MAELVLLGVGDVAASRGDLASMFARVAPVLRGGHVVFGQLEAPLSTRGARNPVAKLAMRCAPAMAAAAVEAGFHAMSAAGNHCLDFGAEALFDTLAHADAAGLKLCGAGATLEAALRPAIVERDGVRVAFLAASSILPPGYAAERGSPGCAPLRAFTHYEAIEPDQPGTPARVRTFVDRGDLARLGEAVRAARRDAEIVVVSLHWGIHLTPGGELADYQREAAYALIDAGADVIFGHHPHVLKPVEMREGRPIFYSLGNFAIEQPQAFDPAIMQSASFRHLMTLNPHFDVARAYVLPPETRHTLIARLSVREGRLAEVEVLPCHIEDESAPTPLEPDDPRFGEVVDYLAHITRDQGLSTAFERRGGAVRVFAADERKMELAR